MRIGALAGVVAIAAAAFMGGCANDGNVLGGLTTASLASEPEAVAKADSKVDPQCAALVTKIDTLRKEGTPERIEKASTGKGATAQVKRQSLAKITELDKANAEYQARCSKLTPAQQAALQVKPAAAAAPSADAQAEQAKQQATQAANQKTTTTVAKKAKTSAAKAPTKTAAATTPAPAAQATAETAAPAKPMATEGVTVSVPPGTEKAE